MHVVLARPFAFDDNRCRRFEVAHKQRTEIDAGLIEDLPATFYGPTGATLSAIDWCGTVRKAPSRCAAGC